MFDLFLTQGLMCTLEDLPLFWKERIAGIDINPSANHIHMKECRDMKYEIIRNPWKDLSKFEVFIYFLWLNLARHLYWPFIDSIKSILKKIVKSNPFFYSTVKKMLNRDF